MIKDLDLAIVVMVRGTKRSTCPGHEEMSQRWDGVMKLFRCYSQSHSSV